jgi:hypothetical protein
MKSCQVPHSPLHLPTRPRGNQPRPPVCSACPTDHSRELGHSEASRRLVLGTATVALLFHDSHPASAVQGFTAGRIPGVSPDPELPGVQIYKRPAGKSGGHGVGWSEIPQVPFGLPQPYNPHHKYATSIVRVLQHTEPTRHRSLNHQLIRRDCTRHPSAPTTTSDRQQTASTLRRTCESHTAVDRRYLIIAFNNQTHNEHG